jgi:hypothetical protein
MGTAGSTYDHPILILLASDAGRTDSRKELMAIKG